MKIVIDIPDNEVPKRREIVEIGLQFMEGEVCECTYPFQVLPKGHGDLIDRKKLGITPIDSTDLPTKGCLMVYLAEDVDGAPAIIEADKEKADNER